jgi:hypothetical protein
MKAPIARAGQWHSEPGTAPKVDPLTSVDRRLQSDGVGMAFYIGSKANACRDSLTA